MIEKTETEKLKTPFELFGIEHGEGWMKISRKVLAEVEKYNADHLNENSFIEVTQVKEKFGELEIYTHYNNVPSDVVEKFREMVGQARAEASVTCENCGTKENVGKIISKWYLTICQDCAEKMVKKQLERGYSLEFASRKWKSLSNGKIYEITGDGVRELDSKKHSRCVYKSHCGYAREDNRKRKAIC